MSDIKAYCKLRGLEPKETDEGDVVKKKNAVKNALFKFLKTMEGVEYVDGIFNDYVADFKEKAFLNLTFEVHILTEIEYHNKNFWKPYYLKESNKCL